MHDGGSCDAPGSHYFQFDSAKNNGDPWADAV